MASPQYASLTELKDGIDEQFLAMLSSDTGADGDLTNLASNAKLKSALERASSDVEAHALRGQRYSGADLASFQASGDATLRGLICDLVCWNLAARRGGDLPPAVEERKRTADRMLKALADGELIFGKSLSAAEAGVIKVSVIAPTTRGRMGLASDSEFFPPAQTRLY